MISVGDSPMRFEFATATKIVFGAGRVRDAAKAAASFGITEEHLPAIAAQAQKASSMRGNPVPLTAEELIEILTAGVTDPETE